MLDLGEADFLQPRNEGKRNRQPRERSRPEQQECLMFATGVFPAMGLRSGLLSRFLHHAGQLRDPRNVQDQSHAAIAHNRRAGIAVQALQLLAQRLDNYFLRIADAIHYQAKLPVFSLQDHDIDHIGFERVPKLQYVGQIDQRQEGPASAVERRVMDAFDLPFSGIAFKTDQFQQAHLRNHVTYPAGCHFPGYRPPFQQRDHQAWDDGERQWDLQL